MVACPRDRGHDPRATTRSPTHRKKKPGRPIDFGEEQRRRYRGRNVVERCFNRLKQWHGIAMRTDKVARNYRAAICLSITLNWIKTDSNNTA
jgi:transposase